VEAGKEHPETIVFTHPGGGHLETFAKNIAPLGESIHAIGLELLWHGFSDAPPIGDERVEQEGEQVLDVLDAMGIEKAWVHGTASSGVIPTWLALRRPERVKGVVYQATTGGVRVQTNLPPAPPTLVGGMPMNEHMAKMLATPTRQMVYERLLHTIHHDNAGLITDELIDVRLALYQRPETNEAMNRYFNARSAFAVTEEEISQLKMPVLVLASDATEQAIAGPQRLASLIPGAQFKVLKKTGLWGHWEAPDEFNAAVRDFILANAKAG
jgi:2-hydroxy-6-oxonona-2,4-dienedioate hydrolase